MSTECTCRPPAGGEMALQLLSPRSEEFCRATRTTGFPAEQIGFTPLTFSAHRTGLASRAMFWNLATLTCLSCHPDFQFIVGMRIASLWTKAVLVGCDQQAWCGVDQHGWHSLLPFKYSPPPVTRSRQASLPFARADDAQTSMRRCRNSRLAVSHGAFAPSSLTGQKSKSQIGSD